MEKQILSILERDARTPAAKIAVMLGKPEDEIAKAIVDMEKRGVIRRYKTVIDWEKAGKERVFAFIDVRVTPSRGVGYDEIARRIYEYPEVHSVYLVSGDYDLRVVVEGKTMQEVAFFVAERLATLEGVLSTRTNFLLKKYKDDGDIFDEPGEDFRLAVAP
jgi:DNA-binding Lrp family transcriptional regulator